MGCFSKVTGFIIERGHWTPASGTLSLQLYEATGSSLRSDKPGF